MMSFKYKGATVVAFFSVSILLQGCSSGPKECEGVSGSDLETCKKCVESANKNSDSSAKALALKACAQVAKDAKKLAEAPSNDGNTQEGTENKPSLQQATTTPKVRVDNVLPQPQVNPNPLSQPTETPKDGSKGTVQQTPKTPALPEGTVDKKDPDPLLNQPDQNHKLVICPYPCNKNHALAQVTENIVGAAAKASLDVASSVVQTSPPVELAANSRSTGRSFARPRARQKMAQRVRNGASEGQDNGIESELAADSTQVTNDANAGQEDPYSGIEVQQAVDTAQVTSDASASQEDPYSGIEVQQAVDAAQVRSVASAGEDSSFDVIKSQPIADTAQVNDVTSGLGNLPNSAESDLQENPLQATDPMESASSDISQHSTGLELRENAVEATESMSNGGGAGGNFDTSHHSVEPRLQMTAVEVDGATATKQGAQAAVPVLQNGPAIGDPVERRETTADQEADVLAAAQATLPVLQQGPTNDARTDFVEQQKPTDPEAVAEIHSKPWPPSDKRYKKGKQSLEEERLNSDNSDVPKQATEHMMVENSDIQKQTTVDTQQQERTNFHNPDVKKQAMVDTQKQELTSDNSDVQQQPTVDTEKQEPVNSGNSDVQRQTTMNTPMQELENLDNSDVQQQAMVDTQKQDFSTAHNNMVQPHKDSQGKNGGRHLNQAENNPPNKGSFQAVVGTSGKVAPVGKPRHGTQGAKMQ